MPEGGGTDAVARNALLAPTLQDHVAEPVRERPWRLGSQVYVAFFGGCIAVTAIALINATKLRVPNPQRIAIAVAGVVGLAATLVFAALAISGSDVPDGARVATQLIAIAAWGPMYLIQRQRDNIYQVFYAESEDQDEAYESLIGPGLAAVIVGGAIQLALVFGVA